MATKNRITNIRFGELVLLFTANKEAISEGIKQGRLTQASLASQHGVAPTTVADLLKAAGIAARRSPKSGGAHGLGEITLLTSKLVAKLLRKLGEPSPELESLIHERGEEK